MEKFPKQHWELPAVLITARIEFFQGNVFPRTSSCIPESLPASMDTVRKHLHIQSHSWAGSHPSSIHPSPTLLQQCKAMKKIAPKLPGSAAGALWHSWIRLLLQCPAALGVVLGCGMGELQQRGFWGCWDGGSCSSTFFWDAGMGEQPEPGQGCFPWIRDGLSPDLQRAARQHSHGMCWISMPSARIQLQELLDGINGDRGSAAFPKTPCPHPYPASGAPFPPSCSQNVPVGRGWAAPAPWHLDLQQQQHSSHRETQN